MAYTKKTWEDLPSTNTPINATDMNDLESRIENGINNALETTTRLTDCDDATTAGVYQYVSTTTNIPPIFAYGNIIVSKTLLGGNNYITQLAIGNDGTTATRGKVNENAWSVWNVLNNTYSTSEQVVGTWGGKPLYRKVYESTTYATAFNVPTENIERLVDIKGMLQRSDYVNVWQPIPSRLDNAGMSAQFGIVTLGNTTNINIVFGSGWESSFRRIVIIVEYTKTTD